MAKAGVRRWWKARELELRALMWEWDPVGLVGAPEDEYDCVVDELMSRLVARSSRDELVRVLEGEAEHFGVSLGSPTDRTSFADRVLVWWARAPSQPPVE
jgi:hypothetical protein